MPYFAKFFYVTQRIGPLFSDLSQLPNIVIHGRTFLKMALKCTSKAIISHKVLIPLLRLTWANIDGSQYTVADNGWICTAKIGGNIHLTIYTFNVLDIGETHAYGDCHSCQAAERWVMRLCLKKHFLWKLWGTDKWNKCITPSEIHEIGLKKCLLKFSLLKKAIFEMGVWEGQKYFNLKLVHCLFNIYF